MIHPDMPAHRARLAPSMNFWYREHDKYRQNRREGLINFAGTTEFAQSLGIDRSDKRMLGNLFQLGGIAHSITLASNAPRYILVANTPASDAIAVRGQEWLNRYAPLIGLGNVARGIALDSYFGYGIVRVDRGLLPPGVRHLTGQQVGPTCRRVSQDNFGYDGDATEWMDVSYIYDLINVPLDDAKKFEPFLAFNPEATERLSEYNRATTQQTNSTVHNSEGYGRRAVAMTRLVSVYFPHTGVTAVWPANDGSFQSVNSNPLLITPWGGHHTGPYAVLSHLDIPDNLIPIPQSESTKALHFLFNELADITSQQAKDAKYNPTYELGSQRDIETWQNAADRQPIPVSNIQRLGSLEIPGPSQSQTSYMNAVLAMWNEFSGNPRDTLGLGATAPTARQSELIRSNTTLRGGEARRKMNGVMELTARKLLHLALNDQNLRFPMRLQLPRTKLTVDVSWFPPSEMPRTNTADDFDLKVVDGSMEMRTAEQRLASLNQATGQILQLAMAAAQGAPIDMESVVETHAEYGDLPELREWWSGILPEFQQQKAASGFTPSGDKPNGQYTRENVSTRTDEGAITQALTQFGSNSAAA